VVWSDVPALLLSGDFDPITPPAYAEIADRTLAHHSSFVFPNGTHGQMSAHPCAGRVMQDFDPTTRPHPDCLQTVSVQPYYTQRNFLHLPLLAGGMSGGLQGIGQAIPKLFWITVPSIMLVLAGLVYGMASLIRRWRGRQTQGQ
jgi:TAP-like protein